MKKVLVTLTVALLTWVAAASMAAATGIFGYQAEVPKALKK